MWFLYLGLPQAPQVTFTHPQNSTTKEASRLYGPAQAAGCLHNSLGLRQSSCLLWAPPEQTAISVIQHMGYSSIPTHGIVEYAAP